MQIRCNRLFATVLYCYKKSIALIHLSTEDCHKRYKEHELGHVIIQKQELQYYTGSKGPYDQNNFPSFLNEVLNKMQSQFSKDASGKPCILGLAAKGC